MPIRDIRLRLNLSQADLGELIGVDQASISRIETGRRRVTLDKLYKIAEVLGVSVTELLDPDRVV